MDYVKLHIVFTLKKIEEIAYCSVIVQRYFGCLS